MRPANWFGSFLAVLLLSVGLAAQGRPVGGGRPTPGNTPVNIPNTNVPPLVRMPTVSNMPSVLFLSGKVRVDDGSELTDPATIESVCNGDRHFEAYTDRKGNFSFEFGKQRQMDNGDVTTSASFPGQTRSALQRRDYQQCELIAVLPGFTSRTVELSGLAMSESVDVGTIVLHRLAQVQGFTISATTAMAPDKARKDYEKGEKEEHNKKWAAAEKKFQHAVQLYPKFAVAWLELGRVQLEEKKTAAAQQSLRQSVAADRQFVSPHRILAVLAFQQHNWQEAVDETSAVLRLNPLSFTQEWLLNSAANYYLGRYDAAEKSARQGIQADVNHRVPKLEYMLGVILAEKHDYQGATEHMRDYLRLAPKAPDAAQVNEQIARIEKVSSAQSTTQK